MSRRTPLKNNQEGFSLIEVMVSLAILVSTSYYIAMISTYSSQQLASTKRHLTAASLADAMLDSLRASELPADLTTGVHTKQFDLTGAPVSGNVPAYYTATWTITENVPSTGLMRIDLVVSWTNASRTQRITLFSFRGML